MCPNTEYFLVRISPHSDCISPCSVRMQGNTDQKILRIWALFTLYSFSLFQKTQNSEFNFRPTEFFDPHVSSSCWQRTGSLFLRKKKHCNAHYSNDELNVTNAKFVLICFGKIKRLCLCIG